MNIRNRITDFRMIKASELRPNPRNWRKHPEAQQNALRGILAEIGYVDALLARTLSDGSLELVDGHLRAETTPDQEVPVLVVDLDEDEAAKVLATFDPLGDMAEMDAEKFADLYALIETDSDALREMLDGLAEEPGVECENDAEPQTDRAEELRVKWGTEAGQLWCIGGHRLLCGDSTKAEDVARLMDGKKVEICFTSPPYNAGSLNIKGQASTGAKYLETSDDLGEDEYVEFLDSIISNAVIAADDALINIGLVEGNKRAIIRILSLYINNFKDIIYWKKTTCAPHIQPGVINNQIEFILCFGDGKRRFKSAQFHQGTYWNVIEGPPASGNEYAKIHKATFPVYLPANIIENFCPPKGGVFEPFLGSGTTMVAAENLNRRCFGIEISPAYCAVILERMATAFPDLEIRQEQ